jgi:hypothetical protein
MRQFNFSLIVILLFNFSSPAQPTTTLRIDPDNSQGGTSSQIFDSIQFIPLQTTKESLFGKIDQLEVTDDNFIILDYMSRSILLFDRSGLFKARIRTDGAEKYFTYFALNRENREIITIINNEKHFRIYDYNGSFLRLEDNPGGLGGFYCIKPGLFVFNLSRPAETSTKDKTLYDLAYSNGYNKEVRWLNPFNSKYVNYDYNITRSVFNYSGQPGSCIFTLPYDYTAYQLNDTGIVQKFNLVFPLQYSLPKDFATDSFYAGRRGKYVYGTPENRGKYEGLQNVYRTGDYLIFTANYSGRFKEDRHFAYNLKTNDLISFGKVVGDSTSDFIPLLSHRALEDPHDVYDGMIFSSIPSVILFNIRNKSEKPIRYRTALQNYFATGTKDDNVVLIQMKLKKDL